ncbi:MAG: cytochrome-c oxidase, cbb3-type subunit III [Rhodospirillales bacterium]|nr:cytochrome-c oxidase, cbb3-type subunit III [Rhodospirillales bacterium]
MAEVKKDALTGIETTGHEWDGIEELRTPIPRWWMLTLWVTVIWAIGYWIVYPAWPSLSNYTKGVIGYSSRAELKKEMARVEESRAGWKAKFQAASVGDIAKDSDLLNYAMAGGRVIFADNCAPCHAAGGAGTKGYPTLVDDDWLWGGTLEAIEKTIRFGIRGAHEDTRESQMPNFLEDETLTKEQVSTVADYVLALGGSGSASAAGKALFEENCTACHGEDGKGNKELGAPNLIDAIWLFGEGKDRVAAQVAKPKHGVMPAWQGRLNGVSIKQVSVYVHSLGGGK